MSIFFFTSSGGTPTANEHSPRPSSPTWWWPSSLVVAPQIGGCGFCSGFGLHAPLRHRPVLALELVLVVGPAADDVLDRLAPHLARLVRVDAEPFELDAGRRAAGAEVDATVAEQVEHRDGLRGAHRMVVGLRHQAGRRSRGACSRSAPRSRRTAPRGSSSASTPRGSGARRSRTRGSRARSPAMRLLERVLVRAVLALARPTDGRPGSRRTTRSASRPPDSEVTHSPTRPSLSNPAPSGRVDNSASADCHRSEHPAGSLSDVDGVTR